MSESLADTVPMAPVPDAPEAQNLFMAPRFPRVNLLPPQVLARRRLQRTQKCLAGGLACLLLSVAGAWFVEHGHVAEAQDAVAAQQTRSAALTAQAGRYAQVPVVLAKVDRAKLAEAQAMVGDVEWYGLLDAISRQAPAGVWITDLSISQNTEASSSDVGAASSATGADPTSVGADPLAKPAIATISINGYGLVPDDVATWLDALTHVNGLSDARYSMSTAVKIGSRPVVQFTSTVGVTKTALSHRFDQKAS